MLKYDPINKTFESLQASELRQENLLERYDFQVAIVRSWEVVRTDLGLPNAYLIGQEIKPHNSVGNSIDLLAFDPDDSSLIVIELKRDRNKLQLLQSLSYAAMVATWDKERLISEIQTAANPDPSELIDYINNNDLNPHIRIMMVAEAYDPEVIITAEWLNRNYGLHLVAFAVSVLKEGQNLIFHFDQRLPLKELADVYERRSPRALTTSVASSVSWEEQIPKLRYGFGAEAVRIFSRIKEGEPSRKRIVGVVKPLDEFSRVDIYFPKDYLRVYVNGTPPDAERKIQTNFSTPIEITPSEGFYGFKIETEEQFDELLKWLKLERG